MTLRERLESQDRLHPGAILDDADCRRVLALLEAVEQCRDQLASIAQALGEYTQPSDVDAWNAADAAIAAFEEAAP